MRPTLTIAIFFGLFTIASPALSDDFVCVPMDQATKKVLSSAQYTGHPIDQIMCKAAQDIIEKDPSADLRVVMFELVSTKKERTEDELSQADHACMPYIGVDSFFDQFFEIEIKPDTRSFVKQTGVMLQDAQVSEYTFEIQPISYHSINCDSKMSADFILYHFKGISILGILR